MLLKQLLESPKNSSKLLVYDPFQGVDREELVKEVVGLANAEVDGPRNILFGVNAGAVDGNGIVGIPETTMADLKKAHRLISSLIEPVLDLAFIYDMINGKLVGTLEIDGCEFGPYFVGQDFFESLSRGQCWIREDRKLREVERGDLVHNNAPESPKKPTKSTEKPRISVGFNDDPECALLELSIPDTSNPPFADEKREVKKPSNLKRAIKHTVGTVTTQILRLGQGEDGDSEDLADETGKLFAAAQNHYYYEEKALQLNLCVCNKGADDIEDVSIEFGFPRVSDFDVADRLFTSPFDKRSAAEVKNMGYPQVERRDDAIFVRSSFDVLAPDQSAQVFRCALRLAVGPGMQGRKLAIQYRLRGADEQTLDTGRLKIKFGQISD